MIEELGFCFSASPLKLEYQLYSVLDSKERFLHLLYLDSIL